MPHMYVVQLRAGTGCEWADVAKRSLWSEAAEVVAELNAEIVEGDSAEQLRIVLTGVDAQHPLAVRERPTETDCAPRGVASGRLRWKVAAEDIIDAAQRDDGTGFCIGCGEEASGVEPDAERYECESCGAMKVYGAEQLLLLGYAGGY